MKKSKGVGIRKTMKKGGGIRKTKSKGGGIRKTKSKGVGIRKTKSKGVGIRKTKSKTLYLINGGGDGDDDGDTSEGEESDVDEGDIPDLDDSVLEQLAAAREARAIDEEKRKAQLAAEFSTKTAAEEEELKKKLAIIDARQKIENDAKEKERSSQVKESTKSMEELEFPTFTWPTGTTAR